ncbi:MAG: ATP-binding protein [Thermoanaerobaculia bacterium]|nr:ATP-binding protein [Thermoanaerobaculia bacterium]
MTLRRAAALLLGLLAAGGLASALAARLAPLPAGAEERREDRLVERARRALESDARRLADVAGKLASDAALTEIVEGGTAGIRPGGVYRLLGAALPEGPGWGIVLLDRSGEAVAWAGEPGDLPDGAAPRAGPFAATFRVTEGTLSHESRLGRSPETQGYLIVTRRFPTGIVRPDLLDANRGPDGATQRRVRVRAARSPDRLFAVSVEPGPRELEEEDVRTSSSRVGALLCGVAAVGLGLLARRPATGAVAARLVLLLAVPHADGGPFARILADPTGLLATPFDAAFTGFVSLVLLRSALDAPRRPQRAAGRLAALVAAVLAASAPAVLGLAGGLAVPTLLLGLGLFTGPLEAPLTSAGFVAVATSLVGLGALLAGQALRPGRGRAAVGVIGLGLVVWCAFASPSVASTVLLLAGAVLLVVGLSGPAARFAGADLLSKAVAVALLVGAGALVTGAGAALGRLSRAESRLEAAASRSMLERERLEEEGPAAWEERIASPDLLPWTPAGSRTVMSDLARALWLRGRNAEFPERGDLLTVRDEQGRVLSSFGTMRPGDEGRGTAIGLTLPVPDTLGVLSRIPWPDADEEDPLLVGELGNPVHADRPVERIDFDGAGRPLGRGRLERSELAGPLLAEVRRGGAGWLTEESQGRRWRMSVRGTGGGFVAWGVEVPTPVFTLVSAVAAAETALPIALLLLLRRKLAALARARLARSGVRRGARLFGTFRGRLALAFLVSGAVPLALGAALVRTALDRSTARATEQHALELLREGRRILEDRVAGSPSPTDLNQAASVVGVDLLLYREGRLAAASRAVPVAAGLAPEHLPSALAATLADGASSAARTRAPLRPGGRRVAQAAVTLSREDRTTLAVVLGEDPAGRAAVDALFLLAAAVALGALALGGRGALALSRPVEELVAASERIGAGEAPGPIRPPEMEDLARLVEAFGTMSERVRDRTELLEREREAAVSVLASLTPAALLFREESGRILYANPAADALLPGGTTLPERLPEPRYAPVLSALRSPRPFEARVTLHGEGRETVLRVVVADLTADSSGPRAVLLLEDLTDFTRAERLEAWVEAARAVAHDIKNPLTPIRLTAERLLRGAGRGTPPDGARVAEAAETILRQVELLTERTGRLSRFASPAAPERARLSGESVRGLLREVAADFGAHSAVKVGWEVDGELPDVFADRALLRDAVSNFVLNAVEALEPRGGVVVVGARPASGPRGGAGLEIACEDDGPGVAEADLARLFDPTFSTKSRGSGMGLAAARRAVEEHGGRLFAERSVRGGLRIGFVLPAAGR